MRSVVDIRRQIEAGVLTPADSIRLAREAVAARDPEIQAFVRVADRPPSSDAGSGPLTGVAVGIKDIIDTADMPTEYGSPIYAGWRPKADAAIVAALRRAGATVVGKTATTPFAFLDPTTTRNPRRPTHTPGGSSSGSAAAVAAGMVPLAFGTQTGGSVIRPASYCGVAGIKPSYRLLPSVGVKTFSWALDTVGLFAAGMEDLAYALAALTGRSEFELGAEAGTPRIAVLDQDFAGDPEQESAAALENAVRALETAGARPKRATLPSILAGAWRAHPVIQDFEARQALAWEYDRHRDGLPPLLRGLLDSAEAITADAYDAGRSTAHRARGALDQVFADADALLTFSAPGPAPEGLGSTGSARFNRLWTLMGVPCVNVPGYVTADGLPVGVQVIAPFGRDGRALAAARFLERAIGNSGRKSWHEQDVAGAEPLSALGI